MTHASLTWVMAAGMAAALGGVIAAAAERVKADVSCQPGPESLQYDCTIKLTDARTGAPLTRADLTVGADMPAMPMAHNVRPVKATPTETPGTFRARIELEMHGDWALQLNVAGAVHDRVIKTLRFEDDHAAERSAPNAPARHKP
jgi:hypothetical protein